MLKRELSNKKKNLLYKHLDKECSFIENLYVRFLLRGEKAQNFLKEYNLVSQKINNLDLEFSDLSSKVGQRLVQEEKAAIFHGERSFEDPDLTPVKAENPFIFPTFALGGALASVIALFVLNNPNAIDTISNNINVAKSSSITEDANINLVSNSDLPVLIEDGYPRAVEVDWVKSAGRVIVIDSPGENSDIIWVKKKRMPIRTLNKRLVK